MPTIIYTPIDAPKPCGRAPIRHDTHRDQRRHHEPKVRPHTQRSQTYGHDTHTRRWLVLTIEGCPEGNRSNRPQIRYPNTLPHTGRRRELISSGTTFIDVPRPAHESQRYKACCKRPKDPTHRRDRTGRLVCAPSAGSRTPPPDKPQRAARRRRSPHIPPIGAPQHLATQYPNTTRLTAAHPHKHPRAPASNQKQQPNCFIHTLTCASIRKTLKGRHRRPRADRRRRRARPRTPQTLRHGATHHAAHDAKAR